MQKKKLKIYLKGFFGHDNTGDDAILDTMLRSLFDEFEEPTINVVHDNPKYIEDKWPVKAIKSHFIRYIPSHIRALYKADFLIFGGGGLLPSDNPSSFLRLLLFFVFAKLLRVSYIIVYSIGIDPIQKKLSLLLARFIFNKLTDFNSVRDEYSYEELAKARVKNIKIIFDPGFLAEEDDSEACDVLRSFGIGTNDKYIIIALTKRWDLEKEKAQSLRFNIYLDKMARIISSLYYLYDHLHFIFIPFKYPEDKEIAELIKTKIKKSDRVHIANLKNKHEVIRSLFKWTELVIAMRYHAVVFAISEVRPVAGISYSTKMDWLLDKTGLNRYSIRIGIRKTDFYKREFDPNYEEFLYKILLLLDEKNDAVMYIRSFYDEVLPSLVPISDIIDVFL